MRRVLMALVVATLLLAVQVLTVYAEPIGGCCASSPVH